MGTGRRTAAAVLCAAALIGGAAGCGGSDGSGRAGGADRSKGGESSGAAAMSDTQRMNESLNLFKGYRSFRMKGEFRQQIPRMVDLRADRQGNCVGTYADSRVPNDVVITGGRAWVRYGEESQKQLRELTKAAAPDKLAAVDEALAKSRGKYIEYAAEDVLKDPGLSLCALDTAFAGIPAKADKAEKRGNPRTRGGVRIVQLTHGSGVGEVSVHVAEKGGNEPRGIDFTLGDTPVMLELDAHDKPVVAKPPKPSETVQAKDLPALDVLAD
ncbi:hypothetical protein ACFU6R_20660 [Streptomyces sp. NPDC057499]|uniref:hypothetical protein n=1 Tax=Streptomyces sp. NPDC057499 TaxID=3346150 RepID=UPI0036C33F83